MRGHLIFYDGTCGLCDQVVQFLLRVDKKQRFVFAPLQGETAKQFLQGAEVKSRLHGKDTLVLIEQYQSAKRRYFLLGKGAFRIFWLLGGKWSFLGIFSFFPAFTLDWGYRLVARHRHSFFPKVCQLSKEDERFLP